MSARRDSTFAAEVRSLRGLCAAAYQAAGASDWPVEWLDNFSDAANGDPLRHEPMSLLPFAPPVEPERSLANARPAFDMEAAAEAALKAFIAERGTYEHEVPVGPDEIREALTAALSHLQPDMEALRRDKEMLDWMEANSGPVFIGRRDLPIRHFSQFRTLREEINVVIAAQAGKQGDG